MKQEIQEGITPRKKNDIVSKGVFSEFFPYAVRFIYKDADQIFDFQRGFTPMDKELLEILPERERAGGTVMADLLYKAYLLNGTEQWILLHFEVEGQSKEEFALRMLKYWYRLFDYYGVPIISVAIFTGDQNQIRPNRYNFDQLGTKLAFEYLTYHVFDHSEEELLAMNDNPIALAVLACQAEAQDEKLSEDQLNSIKIRILEAFAASGRYDDGQTQRFIRFLSNIIYLKDPKLNLKFVETVQKVTGGKTMLGINETLDMLAKEEARHETEEKKNTEFVSNLILNTDFDDTKIASLAVVGFDFVQKIRASLAKKQKI